VCFELGDVHVHLILISPLAHAVNAMVLPWRYCPIRQSARWELRLGARRLRAGPAR